MTIEEKKRLGEWMGWEIDYLQNGIFLNEEIFIDDWHPDTLEHFPEVWNKLTTKQQLEAIRKTGQKPIGLKSDGITLVLNNTPKVLEAVMQVVLEE